jgi:sugar-specific transcriptional regulator TrmB
MAAKQKITPPPAEKISNTQEAAQKLQDDLMSKSAQASTVLTKAEAITQSAKNLLNTAKKTVSLAQAREKDPAVWLSSAREINDSFRNLLKTVKGSEKTIENATSDTRQTPKQATKNSNNKKS